MFVIPKLAARPRLDDVARAAGVSKSTASRILNESHGLAVRPETRSRVIRAAQRLRYRPNVAAQSITSARSRALALLLPDLTNPVFARITRGAYRRAVDEGYVVLIAEDGVDEQANSVFVDLVQTGRVDGLLVASARPRSALLRALREHPVPHVFVNRAVRGSGRNVTVDSAVASATAVRYLLDLGHRHIGHIAGPAGIDTARTRERGFLRAAKEAGLVTTPVARAAFTEGAGADAAVRLLRDHRLTALYVSSLTQAVGVLATARSQGISVPAELSVMTFDNMPIAQYLDPPLTSVEMPMQELGSAAVGALLEQIDQATLRDVVVPSVPLVVPRSSTCAPPSAARTPARRSPTAPGRASRQAISASVRIG